MANIALHVLDQEWERRGRRLGVLVRYADDVVVLCATKDRAEAARSLMAEVGHARVAFAPRQETGIVDLAGGRDGFDFLGWHHRKVASPRRPGRFYLLHWPCSRAMNSIRERIRQITSVAHVGKRVDEVAQTLSRTLRGWGGYFRTGNSARQFLAIERTPTSGWRSSPARSTTVPAGTGSPATTTRGTGVWVSTDCPGR